MADDIRVETGIKAASKRHRVRVVHVSSAHRWSDNRIHLREAASLAAAGFDVSLVALEDETKLPVTGVKPILLSPRRRLSRMVVGSVEAVATGLRTRPHIVHLHDPELFWSVPLLRMIGKKVIYDAHENLPDQVLGKHYLPTYSRRFIAWIAGGAMKVAGTADAVIAATPAIASRFNSERTTLVRNYPVLMSRSGSDSRPRMQRVVYVGAMSEVRGAFQMVSAFAHPDFPRDWSGVIAGSAAPNSLLSELEKEPGWSKIDFLGQVPPEQARSIINPSSVGLVLFQDTPAHRQSLPTKMFEYFAEGIPVVASNFSLWREIIERFECGLVVDQTDPGSVARAIARYSSDPGLLARHQANARAASKVLNWESEERVLIKVYDSMLDL